MYQAWDRSPVQKADQAIVYIEDRPYGPPGFIAASGCY